MTLDKHYSVTAKGDYIHLKTWGELDIDRLAEPAEAALALAKEKHITKLIDDIREIDTSNVSIAVQTKGIGILWKLREFEKVAILFKHQEIKALFFNSLEAMHLSESFRGFEEEARAIAWLSEKSA